MATPKRRLSKSKFSMFLRTQCDRELYLSLFSNNADALRDAGLPIPLKSRPGVELITSSGKEFEFDQYDQLIQALPDHVIHKSSGRTDIDPIVALERAVSGSFILQPKIEPELFRDSALSNIGLATEQRKRIPELSGLIPDVLVVNSPCDGVHEILPDGKRRLIAADDQRLGLSVIDLKNVTEANASYSAEVCLYAFFFANWLSLHPELTKRYFVSDQIYLWRHVEMPRFTEILQKKDGGVVQNRIRALFQDLEDGRVNYMIFMPTVRKFFQEDLIRVISTGDTNGWDSVEYHVNPRCGSCDFLGNPDWLIGDDKDNYEANPTHYCFHCAETTDHLSQMANFSRGATNTLRNDGKNFVSDIVGISPVDPVLRRHAFLRKDRMQIGERASAIAQGSISLDTNSKVGGFARNVNAQYEIVVNFDAGSGFLTGIALRGTLFAPYGESFGEDDADPERIRVLGEHSFVVPQDNDIAEWAMLNSFIQRFGNWLHQANELFTVRGWGGVRTQICFWEPRQYEELCNAFGRHLLKVLELKDRPEKALAWIFPADQLMEREDALVPGIVFIRNIVDGSARLPVKFATTLLSTVESYHHERLTPRSVDKYYREPLGNAIPRERIYAIWKSTTGTVRMFGQDVSIAEAIERYGAVLQAHTWALASITARLRIDLSDCIEGRAPILRATIPSGMRSVAHDSKLWAQWVAVSASTDNTQAKSDLITRAEWLEASYKAVILESVLESLGDHRYRFSLSEDSTESKIEEGSAYCAVGIADWPGFAMQSAQSLGLRVFGVGDDVMWAPLHRVLAATIEEFDRANATAIVQFRSRSNYFQEVFDALMQSAILPLGSSPIYLMEGLPYDDSEVTTTILREIGNPACAIPAPEALRAMGKTARQVAVGTDGSTPISEVLWNASAVSKQEVRDSAATTALTEFAKSANINELNPSQVSAVTAAVRQRLSIVWGPPGTGKTDTLVALTHSIARLEPGKKFSSPGRTIEPWRSYLGDCLRTSITMFNLHAPFTVSTRGAGPQKKS